MSSLLIGGLGTPEMVIILAIIVLVFGASKLPELARGSGRALRIFKAETKGLTDDDDDDDFGDRRTPAQRELEARQAAERDAFEARQAAEREANRPTERRDDTTA
jgi:sec-independent protein translocase protein TatA